MFMLLLLTITEIIIVFLGVQVPKKKQQVTVQKQILNMLKTVVTFAFKHAVWLAQCLMLEALPTVAWIRSKVCEWYVVSHQVGLVGLLQVLGSLPTARLRTHQTI